MKTILKRANTKLNILMMTMVILDAVNGGKYSFEHEYLPVEGKIMPNNE